MVVIMGEPVRRVILNNLVGFHFQRRGDRNVTGKILRDAIGGERDGQQRGRRPAANRRPAEDLNVLIEDMIQLLDVGVQPELRKGRYPDRKASEQIAKVLREIARELDA